MPELVQIHEAVITATFFLQQSLLKYGIDVRPLQSLVIEYSAADAQLSKILSVESFSSFTIQMKAFVHNATGGCDLGRRGAVLGRIPFGRPRELR